MRWFLKVEGEKVKQKAFSSFFDTEGTSRKKRKPSKCVFVKPNTKR